MRKRFQKYQQIIRLEKHRWIDKRIDRGSKLFLIYQYIYQSIDLSLILFSSISLSISSTGDS